VVSTGFLLGEDQPLGLEGQSLELLTRNLVDGVDWPALDHLIVDLPAGTSALQHVLARRLRVSGAIVVVTPQRVAHLDALKVVRLYRHLRIPILGGVENMAYLACPRCGERVALFDPADETQAIWTQGVERLAWIPFTEESERERAFAALAEVVIEKL
jgi:ATP-binding protein involved in chromosome partitioning